MPAGSRLSRVNHWLSIKVCWQTEMVNCLCTGSLTEREFKVAKLIAALHAISASLHGIYYVDSVREQYASLGRVWLECAARAELQSGAMAAPEPKPGQKVA